jgi:hypothetical protein
MVRLWRSLSADYPLPSLARCVGYVAAAAITCVAGLALLDVYLLALQ